MPGKKHSKSIFIYDCYFICVWILQARNHILIFLFIEVCVCLFNGDFLYNFFLLYLNVTVQAYMKYCTGNGKLGKCLAETGCGRE